MVLDDASLIQSLMEQHPVGRALLAAYAVRQDRSPAGTWLERIEDPVEIGVDVIEAEELSRMHGKLIAMGLLEHEVSSKGTGMRYQISQVGRMSLMRIRPESDSIESDSVEEVACRV